jgi:hypothetical protein
MNWLVAEPEMTNVTTEQFTSNTISLLATLSG